MSSREPHREADLEARSAENAETRASAEALFEGREIVRRVEKWTLMYEDGEGNWHELDSRRNSHFFFPYALEDKARLEKEWPDDRYRLAVQTTVIAWPTPGEEESLLSAPGTGATESRPCSHPSSRGDSA